MRRYLLASLLMLVGCSAFSQDHCVPPNRDSTSVKRDSTIIAGMVVYSNPDERAQFVGGFSEMRKYISMNLNYPPVDGCFLGYSKAFLRFIVLKDGSISDVKIMRGVEDCRECDAEAIRVVKSMPNWVPAKVNGQAVNSYFNLPINFNNY